jgi:5-methylcytosine-specific restriction enzyme A
MASGACHLCGVEVEKLERHHLVPRVVIRRRRRRGQADERDAAMPCAMICHTCHRMLHAHLDNGTLDRSYDSLEKLREHPEIVRYLDWRKAHPKNGFIPRVRSPRR